MLSHTEAFARYRTLSQSHLNFVVLVCHAIPALASDLTSPTPLRRQPDHFKANTKEQLRAFAAAYQAELGRTTLITVFSYFEAYVREVLNEIVKFHDGPGNLKTLALSRARSSIVPLSPDMQRNKRKIQSYAKKKKDVPKYQKYSKLLDQEGFRFPTELLAYFGIVNFIAKTDEKRGMRAWEIPDILEQALLFQLSPADRQQINDLRKLRNNIAHGNAPAVTLKESTRAASNLHALAAKIDDHLVEHFFVLQKFV